MCNSFTSVFIDNRAWDQQESKKDEETEEAISGVWKEAQRRRKIK